MDSQNKRMTMHVGVDRLSSLPDDLICKILSSSGIRFVIQTSVLSSRWRYIWTSMLNLSFSSEEFSRLRDFEKYLKHVLTSFNNQVQVSLNLRGSVHMPTVIRILKLAFCHNVQQLTYKLLPDKKHQIHDLPLSRFTSQSLKHLTLIGYTKARSFLMPTSTWELPALTTLHLNQVNLYNDDDDKDKCVSFISKCTNLKSLTLNNCYYRGQNGLTIFHSQLSNLTLEKLNTEWNPLNAVNVVARQLQNLSIINCGGEYIVSAPNLTLLVYRSISFKLSVVDNLYLLEKVYLYVKNPCAAVAHKLVGLLQKFNNVKYLDLSLEIIELLSASVNLLLHLPSPFVNLTRLRIFPLICEEEGRMNVMSTEVKNYLLDSSSATLTMVSREVRRAVRDAKLAENLMAELRVLLDKEKASMKCSNENRMQQPWMEMPPGLSQIQAHMKSYNENRMQQPWMEMPPGVSQIQAHMKSYNENRMQQPWMKTPPCVLQIKAHMESRWLYQISQIDQEKAKCKPIFSLLMRIEGLLTQLPVSMKTKLQQRFDSLHAEAYTVINRSVDHGKYTMN